MPVAIKTIQVGGDAQEARAFAEEIREVSLRHFSA